MNQHENRSSTNRNTVRPDLGEGGGFSKCIFPGNGVDWWKSCHWARMGNEMQCIFNLWSNIMNGRPVTLTVSELLFHTRLAWKRLFHSAHFCDWLEDSQLTGLRRHLREGWWLDCWCLPLKSTPYSTPLFLGERKRGEKKLLFSPFFWAVTKKAWEQSLQGFRNIVSVCRMKSLATEWENERPSFFLYQCQAQWEGGWDKVKEFTASH